MSRFESSKIDGEEGGKFTEKTLEGYDLGMIIDVLKTGHEEDIKYLVDNINGDGFKKLFLSQEGVDYIFTALSLGDYEPRFAPNLVSLLNLLKDKEDKNAEKFAGNLKELELNLKSFEKGKIGIDTLLGWDEGVRLKIVLETRSQFKLFETRVKDLTVCLKEKYSDKFKEVEDEKRKGHSSCVIS